MIKIGLHQAEFFARHGYYDEEQRIGNRFLIDISAGFEPFAHPINDELHNTLNYETLYQIAADEMTTPQRLLETVAQSIADRIKQQFTYLTLLEVTVKKINPPLKGKVAASSVTIALNRQDLQGN